MRVLIILLVFSIGTLIAFSMGARHTLLSASPSNASATSTGMQWATTTDPHEDPQVSAAPPLKIPPRPPSP